MNTNTTKNEIKKVADLLGYNLKMEVQGYEYIEVRDKLTKVKTGEIHTRVQTLLINEEIGVEVTKQLKIKKHIDGAKIDGKTIETINVKEHVDGYDKYYSCDDVKIINETLPSVFELNKSIKLKITNVSAVVNKNDNTTTYAIYSNFKIGTKLESVKIKVKSGVTNVDQFKKLKGQTVLVSNLNISKPKFTTYYNTDTLKNISIIKE